ncbi:hypothetical protein HMSP1_97 [Sinorhizobium phage HMSP1-Susan]|nr:hypothetical protein HMSP1_97 [Sinorhizobium phage HMSP1-Susan]
MLFCDARKFEHPNASRCPKKPNEFSNMQNTEPLPIEHCGKVCDTSPRTMENNRMNVFDATNHAGRLNISGKYRNDWVYFPVYDDMTKQWFVARRRKAAHILISIDINGTPTGDEYEDIPPDKL